MNIRLRPVAPDDAATLERIGPDLDGHVGYGGDPARPPKGGKKWAEGIIKRLESAFWARVIEIESHMVGEVKLHHHDAQNRSARLAIGIFRPEYRSRGVGRKAIHQTLIHAFGPLDLHRVELRVLANNTRAVRAYEAAGFQHEGRLRHNAMIGGEWQDDLVMSVLSTDTRPS
ncbi:MAG: GNAT family protein [Pseudomonadota bacterium]